MMRLGQTSRGPLGLPSSAFLHFHVRHAYATTTCTLVSTTPIAVAEAHLRKTVCEHLSPVESL